MIFRSLREIKKYSNEFPSISSLGKIIVWHGKAILVAKSCAHDLPELNQFDYVLQPFHPRYKECYSDQNLLIKLVEDEGFKGHDLYMQAYVEEL